MVPAEIRKLMHLKQGDRLGFEFKGEQVMLGRTQKPDAFARYAGRYRESKGKTREEINTDMQELRGG